MENPRKRSMSTASRILTWLMAPLVLLILAGWALVLQPTVALRIDAPAVPPDVARTLKAHLWRGELCDPLPCWMEVRVTGVSLLEAEERVAGASVPLMRSEQLSDNGTCPPGAYLVQGYSRYRWLSRYLGKPSAAEREAEPFSLCLKV